MAPKRRRRVDGMAGGAESTSSAKRAKLRKKKKRDALERKKNDLFLRVAKAKELVREAEEYLAKHMPSVCDDLEDENHDELMGKLPHEIWEKIVDEYVQQNDLLALALTCRFFRNKTLDRGKMMKTNLNPYRLVDLREKSHSSGWIRWVCDTFEILPGWGRPGYGNMDWESKRVKGAVYEGNLLNYAAFHGSVEILRWLHEEKGWKLELENTNNDTGEWAGMGGSIEVLEYFRERGYEFNEAACGGAAGGGHLKALKWLRGLDPPCPWNEDACDQAAAGGHLEVLKWLRLSDSEPCPWSKSWCGGIAKRYGHQHVFDWIDRQWQLPGEE